MALQGLSTTEFGNGPIPDWAAALKNRFVRPSQLPGNDIDDWNMVSVNGTTFIKYNDTWGIPGDCGEFRGQNSGDTLLIYLDSEQY